jgi:hypothetical protein
LGVVARVMTPTLLASLATLPLSGRGI